MRHIPSPVVVVRKTPVGFKRAHQKALSILFGSIAMKDTVQVKLNVPHDLLSTLEVSENELGPQLIKLIALELFREERISSGKAAELLGLSKAEFIDLLDQHGIAYFTETPNELRAQVKTIRKKIDAASK